MNVFKMKDPGGFQKFPAKILCENAHLIKTENVMS